MDEREKIQGNITLSENFVLRGTIDGNVTVRPNVLFEIHGIVTGSIYIEPGAEVRILGKVHGNIHNQGSLHVSGMVNGKIADDGQPISYDVGAMINGQHVDATE